MLKITNSVLRHFYGGILLNLSSLIFENNYESFIFQNNVRCFSAGFFVYSLE
jgi:hypothetical protein